MQPQAIFGISVLLGFVVWGMIGRDTSGRHSEGDHALRRYDRCSCCTPLDTSGWRFSCRVWFRPTCRTLTRGPLRMGTL